MGSCNLFIPIFQGGFTGTGSVVCKTHCMWNKLTVYSFIHEYGDGKVHGANMGPIWGRQDLEPCYLGYSCLTIVGLWICLRYEVSFSKSLLIYWYFKYLFDVWQLLVLGSPIKGVVMTWIYSNDELNGRGNMWDFHFKLNSTTQNQIFSLTSYLWVDVERTAIMPYTREFCSR